VLCDEQWVDPDLDDTNGIASIDEPDVLRLDALVMVTQVGEGGGVWCKAAGVHGVGV
jgi:hypothetical protein